MVVIVVGDLFEFRDIEQLREIIEVEHRVVLAVVAKERHVLAQVHILQVIGDEASVTPLNALAELFQNF